MSAFVPPGHSCPLTNPFSLFFFSHNTDLIHDERNSPFPYHANSPPSGSPRNAYELLKTELSYYIGDFIDNAQRPPTDQELQLEACRIVFGAEVLSSKELSSTPSWLRDLLVSSDEVTKQAKMAPIRSCVDSRMATLKILGKDNIFEEDPLERQLHEYVNARRLLGLNAMDRELQIEACNIIGRIEESSNNPSDEVANFLLRLILGSAKWLGSFRQRAHLPRAEDLEDENLRSKDPTTIDSTIHNFSRLESELAEYVRKQRALGAEPSDADLRRQACITIYEFDDGWNQTAADNADWLDAFKQRHMQEMPGFLATDDTPLTLESAAKMGNPGRNAASTQPSAARTMPSPSIGGGPSMTPYRPSKVDALFLNDANCYRRLARELGRYAASVMSRNNPNRHIPTDEELQHQSRWILYDELVLLVFRTIILFLHSVCPLDNSRKRSCG